MNRRGRRVGLKDNMHTASGDGTIIAAFQRQTTKKICPLCGQSVLLTLYRPHLDNCQLASSDSDCEIVQILTAEESRALRVGPSIVIDDEGSLVAENGTASHKKYSQSKNDLSAKQQRSSRIKFQYQTTAEIEVVKVEDEQTPGHGCNSPEGNRLGRTDKNSGGGLAKKARTVHSVSPLLLNKSTSPSKGTEDCIPSHYEKNPISADELVKKIDNLLINSPTSVSSQVATFEDDSSHAEFKSAPYVVKFTLKIMRRVLLITKSDGSRYDESFWREEIATFKRFLDLSNSARELFMRITLRKPWWMMVAKLKERYTELSSSIDSALLELVDSGLFDSQRNLSNLNEALKISPLPVLRVVAKKYQLDITKGKIDLISSLTNFATTQKGLFGQMGTVAVAMLRTIKKELGPCYRVNRNASMLFKALFTLYAPTEMCSSLVVDQPSLNVSQNLLFTLLRMDQRIMHFPAPNPCENIISIFDSKSELMVYVEAKEIETKLIGFLNSNKFAEAYECASEAREKLTGTCEESRAKAASLPIFLRRFTTFEVLMRCTMHGAGVLERQKKYAIAISWQRFLLKTPELKPFCSSHRGALWDRLALNLDAHMKEREEALREIEEGMNDDAVAAKDKLMLQDRAIKISNRDFLERIVVMEPIKKEICGIVLSKDLGDSRVNRFVLNDTDGHCVECSVEEVVRKYYIEYEGFSSGVHAEGSIWHTVLGMLFYDIIFDNSVKNVWFSELQTNPIDLNSKSLYDNRRERFDERFKWIESATEGELAEIIRTTWHAQRNVETSEINWELFQDVEDFLEFFFCCPRLGLLSVLKRIVMDYRNCRSGFPDLTMWNTPTKTIAVVEVKGPGDRLSTKQRLWLDFFTRQNIRAEVCHVTAKSDRELR